MADCVEKGITKTVDVAKYSLEDVITMQEELARYDVPLAINEVEFSVLRRLPELVRLLQACKERVIVLQPYTSLAQGNSTKNYTANHAPRRTCHFSSPRHGVYSTFQRCAKSNCGTYGLYLCCSTRLHPLQGYHAGRGCEETGSSAKQLRGVGMETEQR